MLYLGVTHAAVVAEFRRLVAKQSFGAQDLVPRGLYRYEVAVHDALDLRDGATREQLGLSDQQLFGEDRSACEAIGRAAFANERTAVIAPSATGHDDVLAVFLDHVSGASTVTVGDYEVWEEPPGDER